MNGADRIRSRDRAAWTVLAVLMAAATLLGVIRVIGGTGGWDGVLVPGALTAGCAFMLQWTKREHRFTKKK